MLLFDQLEITRSQCLYTYAHKLEKYQCKSHDHILTRDLSVLRIASGEIDALPSTAAAGVSNNDDVDEFEVTSDSSSVSEEVREVGTGTGLGRKLFTTSSNVSYSCSSPVNPPILLAVLLSLKLVPSSDNKREYGGEVSSVGFWSSLLTVMLLIALYMSSMPLTRLLCSENRRI